MAFDVRTNVASAWKPSDIGTAAQAKGNAVLEKVAASLEGTQASERSWWLERFDYFLALLDPEEWKRRMRELVGSRPLRCVR